jgi:hypothetical protein
MDDGTEVHRCNLEELLDGLERGVKQLHRYSDSRDPPDQNIFGQIIDELIFNLEQLHLVSPHTCLKEDFARQSACLDVSAPASVN